MKDLINESLRSAHLTRELGRNQNVVLYSSCSVAEVHHTKCLFMDPFFSLFVSLCVDLSIQSDKSACI